MFTIVTLLPQAVLTGMYTNMVNGGSLFSSGFISLSFYAGMSADELTFSLGNNNCDFYTNSLSSLDISPDFWSVAYQNIYVANAAIEGISASSELSPAVKQQALGEATFVRAFNYFYLVTLYGDVPLVPYHGL